MLQVVSWVRLHKGPVRTNLPCSTNVHFVFHLNSLDFHEYAYISIYMYEYIHNHTRYLCVSKLLNSGIEEPSVASTLSPCSQYPQGLHYSLILEHAGMSVK